jgi:light-regulated signal transduction histidine kinase (bacteriophytochrome)
MRQLFANLITNALKFKSPARKPDIRISSEITDCVDMYFPNKKFHKITVSDNGIGIEKEYLKKIFVIFQRLHLPEEYTGNGIGLAICKRIMENHFGKIAAESVHGEGSTMILYFPVKTDLIK